MMAAIVTKIADSGSLGSIRKGEWLTHPAGLGNRRHQSITIFDALMLEYGHENHNHSRSGRGTNAEECPARTRCDVQEGGKRCPSRWSQRHDRQADTISPANIFSWNRAAVRLGQ